MWNPFAREQRPEEGAPSIVPPRPEVAAPDAGGPTIEAPPAAATAPAAESDQAPRNRIADVQLVDGAAVATVNVTELSHDTGATQLTDLLIEMEETGAIDFVLDLHSVQFMDSACLGCLVEALNRITVRGGRIALANGNHSVQYLFRLTRLDRVFSVCPDVLTALQQIERRRQAG